MYGVNTMAEQRQRRLVFVKAADLELWRCRPIGTIDVLDVKDRRVGHIDGLIVDVLADRPLFLVIRRDTKPPRWLLVPVGEAWFDDTEHAVRIDAQRVGPGGRARFDPDEFDRMSGAEAADYERKVLALCCPELGLHRNGTPNYARLSAFRCPNWLRSFPGEGAGAEADRAQSHARR
jgi:hypothetical protein